MDEPRLRWNGNNEAQRMADEAYAKLRDKPKKKRSVESKRRRRRARDKRKGRVSYRDYICSKKWKRKRRAAIKYYGAKCDVCGRAGPLYVHHLNYKTLGHERMEDLQVLCLFCHEDQHPDKAISSDPISEAFRAIVASA